jgi:sugar lactone lactonase YvrE
VVDQAVRATSVRAHHGESAVWWPDGSGLRLVDMLRGELLHVLGPDDVVRVPVAATVAAPRPRRGGGVVLGSDRGFVLLDADLRHEREIAPVVGDPALRMNEGGCDPGGSYWCGTAGGRPGAAALYRLDPDGAVTQVLRGVTTSNGIGWAPDGTRAYYVDSALGRVDVADVDEDGSWHDRRPFAEVPAGVPDGLAVDSAGGVWVALWDGGAVVRFGADGGTDRVVEVPTPRVTSCALGGDDLRTLHITTSRHGLAADDGCAGAVFTTRVDVPGLPTRTFDG